MSKLWSGRFSEDTAEAVQKYTESISYDYRLFPYDIKLNITYAEALQKAGVLKPAETKKIIAGLKAVEADIFANKVKFDTDLEDIHMNIENLLTKKIGDLAKKIHTGKSRNDQVATDVRMYLKDQIVSIVNLLEGLVKQLIEKAEKNISVIMPGYTHLQVAQPILFAHHLLAYQEMFWRDRERLINVFTRTDVLPLGSAALAGSAYSLDRNMLAEKLWFSKISENSLDAVSDRDFIIEFQSAVAILMVHLSRMAEELIIWSSDEFKFVELADAYTTGSSIMPQKKNPDIPELLRGKTGTVFGALMAILSTVKALPLAYNRDLQEDKENLFKTVEIVKDSLQVLTGLWATININQKKMTTSAEKSFCTATDLADYLVGKGIAFREAHEITGKIVKYCLDNNLKLKDLALNQYKKFNDLIEQDVFKAITLENSVRARNIYGGTAPVQVEKAIQRAKVKWQK